MEFNKEQKVIQGVIQKAWEDACFKKKLIEDPIHTIESFANVNIILPIGKTLVVNDQSDSTKIYFNIPEEPKRENIELGEGQLDAIAGGGKYFWRSSNVLVPNVTDILKISS